MALIVEDGTGLAGAESFISVAGADAYLTSRGSDWSSMSTTEKEQALRRATDYMEQMYRERWAGQRVTTTQALSWPRYFVPIKDASDGYSYWPSDAVPTLVANACAALALKAAAGDLAPDVGRLKRRTKVGPLEVEYEPNTRPYTVYRSIDNMLLPFFGGLGGLSIPVVRV